MAARWLVCAAVLALACVVNGQVTGSFNHGIASGDPLADRIILWTRVTPRPAAVTYPGSVSAYNPLTPLKNVNANYPVNVTWTVYSDAAATRVVSTGSVQTDIDRDWTVKVDVGNLTSGVQYVYKFQSGAYASELGTFRLPYPEGDTRQTSLKYFVLSCSNWGHGYFNAYDVASRYDLDFWLHAGDYLYEYGVNNYPSPQQATRYPGLQPEHDIETLDDYRLRHALYRTDMGLQALTASAPLVSLWDDHEVTNNVYANGAENQYPGQINFFQRKYNAARAYYEWMPIRDPVKLPTIYQPEPANFYAINRTFAFGDLARLWVLEDRLTGRTDAGEDSPNGDPARFPSVFTSVGAVVGNIPVEQWNASVVGNLTAIRTAMDTRRTSTSERQLDAGQEAWLANTTRASVARNTTWQLYMQGSVMQDWFFADVEGAIQRANASGNSAQAATWSETLRNLTTPTATSTWTQYGLSVEKAANYSKSAPVTPALVAKYRGALALGRYRFNFGVDAWQGYIADRNRVLEAIRPANNPIVYSGDSHCFWAGYLKIVNPQTYVINQTAPASTPAVAVEFATGSVTSSNFGDSYSEIPPELQAQAWIAANAGHMFYSDVAYHGGIFVNLTRDTHHAEMIMVDTIASPNYTPFCAAAYDVPKRNSTGEQPRAVPGRCGPIPQAAPYSKKIAAMSVANAFVPRVPTTTSTA